MTKPHVITDSTSTDGYNARPARRMTGPPIVEFRSSTRAWLFQSGQGWQIIAAALTGIGVAAWQGYWQYGAAVVAGLGLPLIIWRWLKNRTSIFWLDGDRLFMRRGIIVRSEEEVELYRVKDVKVTFSIIQQMFDNGDLTIASSDRTGLDSAGRSTITVSNVVDARAIRGEIRNRVEAVRERRGVRELDIG